MVEAARVPEIASMAGSEAFGRRLCDLLVDLCRIDTTPDADPAAMAQREGRTFDIVEEQFGGLNLPKTSTRRLPIDPQIAEHPFFSQLYYTNTQARPDGLTAEQAYAGRSNLILTVPGAERHDAGVAQAINVHVDVVAPYFPPRVEGQLVHGRGACDDKGPLVALLGAGQLIEHYLTGASRELNRALTVMIVVDEESGGNGSLALAIDRQLRQQYDSLMVLECCNSDIHPGNRGCVWYKLDGRLPGANLFEAAAYIIEAMEAEGRAIKAESDHPLFPHRPVQTCHGIIGNNGEHPSRINGQVAFDIVFDTTESSQAEVLVTAALEEGLQQYITQYGDKTKMIDTTTGKAKVDHHYDLSAAAHGYVVTVHGSTGHMGSIDLNDGAITKAAAMVRALVEARQTIEQAAGASMQCRLHDWAHPSHLVLEGGQGFLPTHTMTSVQERMRQAAWRGADRYLQAADVPVRGQDVITVSYDKLHNEAFAGSADSTDMQHAIAAAHAAGMRSKGQAIRGWDVSCDARIFACEYPDLPVLTAGPGSLEFAHSDREHVDMTEMTRFAEFLAYFILMQTGSLPGAA